MQVQMRMFLVEYGWCLSLNSLRYDTGNCRSRTELEEELWHCSCPICKVFPLSDPADSFVIWSYRVLKAQAGETSWRHYLAESRTEESFVGNVVGETGGSGRWKGRNRTKYSNKWHGEERRQILLTNHASITSCIEWSLLARLCSL